MTQITGVHPLADLFPMMSDPELRALAEDIKANGLREPLQITKDGVLVEGRNRLKACEMADVEPTFEEVNGDAVALIVSANIMRRHMTAGQIAILAVVAEAGIDLPKSETPLPSVVDDALAEPTRPVIDRNQAFRRVENLVSRKMIDKASMIVRWAPDHARMILDSGQGLTEAERVASERSSAANNEHSRRAKLAEDSPELLAKVDDAFSVNDAWRIREDRLRKEREDRARNTGYLVDRVKPLLGKSNNVQDFIALYDPEQAKPRIGTAEIDEAIEHLRALRREIIKQKKG